MDQNTVLSDNSMAPPLKESSSKETRLVDIEVVDQNTALNLMVGFLTLAHKRGVFGIDESAKIWDCIKKFQN